MKEGKQIGSKDRKQRSRGAGSRAAKNAWLRKRKSRIVLVEVERHRSTKAEKQRSRKEKKPVKQRSMKSREAGKAKSRQRKKQKSREVDKQRSSKSKRRTSRNAEKQRSRKAERQNSRKAGKHRTRNQKKSKTCRGNKISIPRNLMNFMGVRKADPGGQKSKVGGQRNKVGDQKNKVGGQKNKVGGQKNKVRVSKKNKVGGQKNKVRGLKKQGVKKTRWGVKKTGGGSKKQGGGSKKQGPQLKAVRRATYHVRALRSCGGRPLHFLSPTTQRDVFDDTRLCPEKENISINEKTCKALFSIFAVAWFLHRYSLVHLLPTSSTKSARPFLTIFMWNRALATVSCTFCRPHLPKVLRAPQLFLVLCDQLYTYLIMMRLAYDFELSISCAFCRPHLPKVPRAPQCFTICEITLSLQSRAPFADLICQKFPAPLSVSRFVCEIALSLQCTFCRPHLPKVLRARQFFFDFYVKSSLKVPDSFLRILCEIVL